LKRSTELLNINVLKLKRQGFNLIFSNVFLLIFFFFLVSLIF